ncbi:hypothetical protein RYX36_004181, partial [Vicia faba]
WLETLKDYTIKALVNTVDHLGYVTYKVNDLLDEKVVEFSGAELHVSCIEQVMAMLLLHLGEAMIGANLTKSKYVGYNLKDEEEWPLLRNGVYFYRQCFDFTYLRDYYKKSYIVFILIVFQSCPGYNRETPTSTTT